MFEETLLISYKAIRPSVTVRQTNLELKTSISGAKGAFTAYNLHVPRHSMEMAHATRVFPWDLEPLPVTVLRRNP